MSKPDFFKNSFTILIFFLILILFTGVVIASDNNSNRNSLVISNKKRTLLSIKENLPIPEHNNPNLVDLHNLKYLFPKDTSSIAEIYLGRIAEKSRNSRKAGGVLGLALGTGLAALGYSLIDYEPDEEDKEDEEDFAALGKVCLGAGVLLDAVSIWGLITPSREEREYSNVLSIEDLATRELTGHEVLVSLADEAERNRIYSAVGSGVFGLYYFIAQPLKRKEYSYSGWNLEVIKEENSSINNYFAALFVASALSSLLNKSSEEKALKRYLEEVEQKKKVGLRLNINPIGRKISLVISF